jgi:hypothetical protein
MQESIETLHTELEQRLSFETILAETSTRFINVPADRIDSQIEDAQRRICEFLDIDRSTLWQAFEGERGGGEGQKVEKGLGLHLRNCRIWKAECEGG